MSYHFFLGGGWPDQNYKLLNVERIGVVLLHEGGSNKPKSTAYFETSVGVAYYQPALGTEAGAVAFNEDTVEDRVPDRVIRHRMLLALPFLRQRRTHLLDLAMDSRHTELSRGAIRRDCNRLYWKAASILDPVQFPKGQFETLAGAQP